MKFYLAPMEGVTGYIYRNAYHAHFRPMDSRLIFGFSSSMLQS